MVNESRYTSIGLRKRTKTVRLIFKREELLYDIKNYAYVEGDVMQVNLEHDRHQVFDIGEDGNIDRVTRMLDLSHAECVEALFPYTKEQVEQKTEMNNAPTATYMEIQEQGEDVLTDDQTLENEKPKDYEISLLVPDEYSKTTAKLLVRYIHEYMVCRVLADWMSITNPSSANKWKEKEHEMLEGMKEAVHFRTGRVRRTQTPF